LAFGQRLVGAAWFREKALLAGVDGRLTAAQFNVDEIRTHSNEMVTPGGSFGLAGSVSPSFLRRVFEGCRPSAHIARTACTPLGQPAAQNAVHAERQIWAVSASLTGASGLTVVR
jgi:hypothetical protein